MSDQITPNHWLILKTETRQELSKILMLPKTGLVEVVTDEFGKSHVKSDGHTYADLQNITIQKLLDYLGTGALDETIYDLFKRAVDKVEGKEEVKTHNENGDPYVAPMFNAQAVSEILPSNGPLADPVPVQEATVDNPYKCPECLYSTPNKRALTMHKTVKHRKAKAI